MKLIQEDKYISKEGECMTAIRREVLEYINDIPDSKLEALKPLLTLLMEDTTMVIETDLTDEEKTIIRNGREEYKQGNFIGLDTI